MSDLISRRDALMEARPEYLNPQQQKLASYNQGWNDAVDEYYDGIKELPSAEAVCEDTQTEERTRFVAKETELAYIEARLENAEKRLQELPKYTNCTEFIEWLTEVVLNDEDWELNAVAYGEVIARKLKKLGLLEVKDGYYIRHIENNTKESDLVYRPSAEAVSDIRKLQHILLMKIHSFEGTRNIVEKGMLEAWKDVAEYIDGMLEGGDDE